jgi:hypothetical protein
MTTSKLETWEAFETLAPKIQNPPANPSGGGCELKDIIAD